jgi:hypothetical protein
MLVRLAAAAVAFVALAGPIEARRPPQTVTKSSARNVIWRDPGPIAELDLSWKSDASRQPPVPPFTFVKEDESGTRAKIIVTDRNGAEWSVKLAKDGESHAEVAAARLTWAVGYFVEESYYVPEGAIEKVGRLNRARSAVDGNGRFDTARFERRPAHRHKLDERWSFDKNPFLGTQELSGLAILMTMINNWDLGGTRNTAVMRVPTEDGFEHQYLVSDLGSSFGRMGDAALITRRSKWNLEDFREQKFIDRVSNGMVDLHFAGIGSIDLVPIDHARWFAGLVSQLTDAQLRQAFEAAGATPAEIEGFSDRLREKIVELQRAVSSTTS